MNAIVRTKNDLKIVSYKDTNHKIMKMKQLKHDNLLTFQVCRSIYFLPLTFAMPKYKLND